MGDSERIIGDGLVLLAGSRGTRGDPEELVRLFHKGRVRQERLEKAGHCSPQWEALRSSVQQVNGTSEHHHRLSSLLCIIGTRGAGVAGGSRRGRRGSRAVEIWRSGFPRQVLIQRQTASRRCGKHGGEPPRDPNPSSWFSESYLRSGEQ